MYVNNFKQFRHPNQKPQPTFIMWYDMIVRIHSHTYRCDTGFCWWPLCLNKRYILYIICTYIYYICMYVSVWRCNRGCALLWLSEVHVWNSVPGRGTDRLIKYLVLGCEPFDPNLGLRLNTGSHGPVID